MDTMKQNARTDGVLYLRLVLAPVAALRAASNKMFIACRLMVGVRGRLRTSVQHAVSGAMA